MALAVIGFLAWKNKERAKEMIFSLISYEGVLTGELCIETWCGHRSLSHRASIVSSPALTCLSARDIAGDAAYVNEVRGYRDKAWVNELLIPYA